MQIVPAAVFAEHYYIASFRENYASTYQVAYDTRSLREKHRRSVTSPGGDVELHPADAKELLTTF